MPGRELCHPFAYCCLGQREAEILPATALHRNLRDVSEKQCASFAVTWVFVYALPEVPRCAVISACLGLFVTSPAEMLSGAVPELRGGDAAGSSVSVLPSSH